MWVFQSSDLEDLIDEFNLDSTDISIFITSKICEAIEKNEDQILMGIAPNFNLIGGGIMQFIIEKENYLDSLQTNLFRVEEAEDYELCIRIRKYMDLLKEK
jgi:hypothetical protein